MTEFWWFQNVPEEQIAVVCPGAKSVTYGQLSEQADAWVERIAAAATQKPGLAVLDFSTSVEAIAAYVGLLRAGVPVLVLEPGQLTPDSRLAQVWQPELHIQQGKTGLELSVLASHKGDQPAPHPDLRVLLSTSGTTGDPKLVRLSGQNIDSNAVSIAEYLGLTPSDRAVTTLPFFYSYGLSVLNSYLAAGASVMLTDRSVVEASFWEEARVHKATSLALVPHQFDLLDHGSFDGSSLPTLRYITQAGGKMAAPVVRQFHEMGQANGWNLIVMYGQTEAAPRMSYIPSEKLLDAPDTIGQAIPGGSFRLIDEDGAEITTQDTAGELVYAGPNVMMGYATQREDLAKAPELTELQTGDIAERTEQGFYRVVGRLKRFVKLYGLRLSLDQIETGLRDKGIAVQAVSCDDRLVLFHHNSEQGAAACDYVSETYHVPTTGIFAEHLSQVPLLPSGKTDFRALTEQAKSVIERRRDDTSEDGKDSLVDVMKRATRRENVGPYDSFVSLGGDSLSYLQMQLALEERLGRAPEGWETMTLGELSALRPAENARLDRSVVRLDVMLRLLAIFLVVGQHASDYKLFGGTWMLVLLMGYSAARFQQRLIASGQPFRLGFNMLYPILPIYFLLMYGYMETRDMVPTSYWSLLGNYYIWPKGKLIEVYWFVNLYAQLVMLIVLAAAIPATRRAVGRAPWFSVALLLLGTLIVQGAIVFMHGGAAAKIAQFPVPHIAAWGFLENVPIFLTGWLLFAAKSMIRRTVTLVLAAATIAMFTTNDPSLHTLFWLIVATTGLFLNVDFLMPKGVAKVFQLIASSTMFIYLIHQVLIHGIFQLGWSDPVELMVAWVVSFSVGVAVKLIFERVDPLVLWMNRRSSKRDKANQAVQANPEAGE